MKLRGGLLSWQACVTYVLWLMCLALRLLQIHFFIGSCIGYAWFVSVHMPLTKKWGRLTGSLFAMGHIIIYDALTSYGLWTLITAGALGIISTFVVPVCLGSKNTSWAYFLCACATTCAYDLLTGLTIGPLFFGQPFFEALYGQFSWTSIHILGNGITASIVSPCVKKIMAEGCFRSSQKKYRVCQRRIGYG